MNEQIKTIMTCLIPAGTKGYGNGYEMQRRVYDTNGIAPTLKTFSGGNLEPKVIIYEINKNPPGN